MIKHFDTEENEVSLKQNDDKPKGCCKGQKRDEKAKLASIWSLFKFTSKLEKVILIVGLITAVVSGICQPLFIVWVGDMYDAFGDNVDVDDTINQMKDITLIFLYIGLALWLLSYVYYAALGTVSEMVGLAFR